MNAPVKPMWQQREVCLVHGYCSETHIKTGEDYDAIALGVALESVHTPQVGKAKEWADAILCSTYCDHDARTHEVQQQLGSFVMLWADIDEGDHPIDDVVAAVDALVGDCAYAVHSTASAKLGDRRWRVIIPITDAITFDDWRPTQGGLNVYLGRKGIVCDEKNLLAGQVCILPLRGAVYEHKARLDGAAFDPFASPMLTEAALEWEEAEAERVRKEAIEDEQRHKSRAAIAKSTGKGPIDRYNASHTVEDLLAAYGYKKGRNGKWKSPHQTSPSAGTSVREGDDKQFWVSFSSSDGAAGLGRASRSGHSRWGDAFDLFVHYEHGGDRKAALAGLGGGQRDWDVPDQIPGSTDDAGNLPPSAAENLHPYLRFEIPETDTFMAPEFVLDGIMIAGSVILAGGWGVGKTSQLVPLLFRAAHLCAPDDPLRPLLRRRVVYISEDVEQVRQIVRSMRAAGELDGISKEEVEDYFRVVSAVRMKPEEIIKVAKPYAGLAVTNNSPATGVSREAHALVVFDTRSACIDLDDESDNTEAGRVMATLRQGFPDNPQLIVGHIAKALKKADAGDLSGRGAGAWEADAQQVLYLVEKDGERWLDVAGPKHRFVASVDGIAFETVRSETSAIDPLGRSVTMQLVHGKPRKVQLGQRVLDKARLAEENEREARNATRTEVLTLARELHEAGAGCNRARLKKDIKRQSKVVVEMIDELLDEGWLLEMPIEASVRRHPRNAHYLFPPSPSERDAYLKTGGLPPAAHQPPRGFVKPA